VVYTDPYTFLFSAITGTARRTLTNSNPTGLSKTCRDAGTALLAVEAVTASATIINAGAC